MMLDERTRSARRALVALAATLAIQIYTSLVASAAAVLAPEVAPAFGVSPALVGVFIGILYVGSMSGSLVSGGLIGRYGAIRVSQVCVLLCAIGLALLPLAVDKPLALMLLAVAPLIIGVGYGPITPASSQVLARTAPPSRMALTFSIKQTGVPAGAALAGAILPALALASDWRTALGLVALAGLAVAIAAQAVRADLDRERDAAQALSLAGIVAPLRQLLADRRLVELTALSFFYSATQVSLTSFVVVYFVDTLGRSLVVGGVALSVATIGGVAGRVIWGAVADRTGSPRGVLAGLGLVAGGCGMAVATWPAGAPLGPLFAVLALFGATAIGWNGVMLSEVARLAPPGRAGAFTGAASFITFGGVVCGPPAFALLAGLAGSYRAGFVAMGIASLLAAAGLALRTFRAGRAATHGTPSGDADP